MALSNAMPSRFRAVVQLASWCQLRKGELCALRRRDIDLLRGRITVAQNLQQLRDGRIIIKEPKSDAGFRTIAVPPHIIPLLEEHLRLFTVEAPDALVFTGERGGPVRPHVLQKHWEKTRLSIGRPELHLHDLRHTGNTWAAATGASTAGADGAHGPQVLGRRTALPARHRGPGPGHRRGPYRNDDAGSRRWHRAGQEVRA